MAWDDANRNRGYQNHVRPKRGGIVEYSASTEDHYFATTEQVVEFRGNFPAMGDGNYSSTKKELYKDHGIGDKPAIRPWWSSARDEPEKARDFSPPYGNQVTHGQNKGSPKSNLARDFSPPYGNQVTYGQNKGSPKSNLARDQPEKAGEFSPKYGKYDNFSSEYGNQVTHGQNKGSPKSNLARDQPEKAGEFSPKYGKYDNFSSEYGKYDNFSSEDDDDVTCQDGVCYPKPNHFKEEEKYNGNGLYAPLVEPRKDSYTDKNKGNGHVPPYTVQPIKDHTTYYPDHNNEKYKGNGYAPVNSYTVPVSSPPKKDTIYHETINNRPLPNNPPPIKTRFDPTIRDSNGNNRNSSSPVRAKFRSSVKEDPGYKETIDSTEARRRHGGVMAPRAEDKYEGTITCSAAAKKYNGLILNT